MALIMVGGGSIIIICLCFILRCSMQKNAKVHDINMIYDEENKKLKTEPVKHLEKN